MAREIKSLGSLVSELVMRLEDGRLHPGFSAPVHRGSASGKVQVVPNPNSPEAPVIVVTLQIMRLPANGQDAFFRRLLELNGSLWGRAAFWVGEDDIVRLHSGRSIEDMDPSELVDLILWTSEQADYFDDELLEEFGRENDL